MQLVRVFYLIMNKTKYTFKLSICQLVLVKTALFWEHGSDPY